MREFFMILMLLISTTTSAIEPLPLPKVGSMGSLPVTPGIQALMNKPPEELNPEVAVIVGTIFCEGSDEMRIKVNTKKCFRYLEFASQHNVTLADLVLANQYAKTDNHDGYKKYMERIVVRGDKQLSVPAGLQLAGYYAAHDNIKDSVRLLRFVADVYGDSRAQFMIAFSILNNDYIPDGMSKKDGSFYLYQACKNDRIDPLVERQCALYYKEK